MAEIRSTMDMVMERAAKMAADSKDSAVNEGAEKVGMRLEKETTGKDGLPHVVYSMTPADRCQIERLSQTQPMSFRHNEPNSTSSKKAKWR